MENSSIEKNLIDDTILYEGLRFPCKNNQEYCDPSTRTQATIVWFLEDTCTTFKIAENHARIIKFYQKDFIHLISFEKINPDRFGSNGQNYKVIDGIEKKIWGLQIYPETEVECFYPKPLFKTQFSEFLVEHKKNST